MPACVNTGHLNHISMFIVHCHKIRNANQGGSFTKMCKERKRNPSYNIDINAAAYQFM